MWNDGAVEVSQHVNDHVCIPEDSRRGISSGGSSIVCALVLGRWLRLRLRLRLLLLLLLRLLRLLLFRLRLLCLTFRGRSSRCTRGWRSCLAFARSVPLEDGAHPLDIFAQPTALDILALGGRSGIGGCRHACCGNEKRRGKSDAATAVKDDDGDCDNDDEEALANWRSRSPNIRSEGGRAASTVRRACRSAKKSLESGHWVNWANLLGTPKAW